MADEDFSTDEKVRRGVARALGNFLLLIVLIALLGAWVFTGYYELRQAGGEAALVLRFGEFQRTETQPGWHLHLPIPIESHEKIRMEELQSVEFGSGGAAAQPGEGGEVGGDLVVQTQANNVVTLAFAVQYKRKDAYQARYKVADPEATLRAAAQAAVREVVGRTSIDDVLSEGRGRVQSEAKQLLEEILDRYDAGLEIDRLLLQEVAPPRDVRDAFDDVIAAEQDGERQVQEAEGYRNEVLPQARAQAVEIVRSAEAYRDAKVAEAAGEAARFSAILTEYERAPEVTRKRLYLEAMEDVLPKVQKLVIQPGTGAVLPYFPPSAVGAPPTPSATREGTR